MQMRIAPIVLVILLGGLGLAFVRSRPSPEEQAKSADERAKRAATSAMLRHKVLSREFLTGAPRGQPGDVRCVVMDWNVGDGVATLVAFDDGTTSLYFSFGGGVIGAGAREAVRRVATSFRGEAAKVADRFTPATEYPLPPGGKLVFYVVTDSATLSSGPITDEELQRSDHPLSDLARSAQEVITQIRKAS
jgi:hypothetical protein